MCQPIKFLLISYLLLLTNTSQALDCKSKIQGRFREDGSGGGVYDRTISDDEVLEFVLKLKSAIARDDRREVAKIANCTSSKRGCRWYTHDTNGRSVERYIENEDIFLKNYDEIITDSIKSNLAKVKGANDISAKFQGFSICNGSIWFDPKRGVITFNSSE